MFIYKKGKHKGIMKKEHCFNIIQTIFSILFLIITLLLVHGRTPAVTFSLPKTAAISLYYFFYFTGQWLGWKCLLLAIVTTVIICHMRQKEPLFSRHVFIGTVLFTAASLLCFFLAVLKTGHITGVHSVEICLRLMSLCWGESAFIAFLGCTLQKEESVSVKAISFSKRHGIAAAALLFLSCLPIVLAGKYVYPQGDDFEYGVYCYQAWTQTGSVWNVLKGALEMVQKAFGTWQGTFSSIFLMALHPGIWGTAYYHLVPLILLFLLISSILFFFYALFCKVCSASRAEAFLAGCLTAFLTIQFPVSKASAFFWYNGAIHYTGAFSFLLFFLAFVLCAIKSKKKTGYLIAASVFAVFVGGGNLVTALTGCILVFFLPFFLWYFQKSQHIKTVLVPGIFMLLAFSINVLAPGNSLRQDKSGEDVQMDVFSSILESFQICLDNALREWSDWFWILFLLLLLPLLWSIVQKTNFDFRLPGLVLVAGYCLLSAMYTPQLYAIGVWKIGRIQNITHEMFLILSVLNEFYLTGWLSKRCRLVPVIGSFRTYYAAAAAVCLLLLALTAAAAPKKMTNTAIAAAVKSGEAQKYASAIRENIELLESSPESFVRVKEPPRKPEIFVNGEIETWRSGAAAYYGKDAVRYIGED